jgi:hypothetical protein
MDNDHRPDVERLDLIGSYILELDFSQVWDDMTADNRCIHFYLFVNGSLSDRVKFVYGSIVLLVHLIKDCKLLAPR